jgi:hypothetical protein
MEKLNEMVGKGDWDMENVARKNSGKWDNPGGIQALSISLSLHQNRDSNSGPQS